MIAVVIAANAVGLRATARLQLGLAGVLAALLLIAIVTALPESRAENWTPFAPHGWGAVGTAASLLMLSFIGWEAVSHLAGELRDPARQLPCAIFSALGADLLGLEGLVRATSASFVAVYVTATAAGVRLLGGAARRAAGVAFAAVLVVLAFFGPFLVVPATIAALYAALSMTAASRSTAVSSSACAR